MIQGQLYKQEPDSSCNQPKTSRKTLSILRAEYEYTVFARVISAPAYFAHPNF